MAEGVWTLHDDGTFELQEPYATQLTEARLCATYAWREALYGYLMERTPYTHDELNDEMMRRVNEGQEPTALVEEFVIEALSGDLIR
jgi:hypothetical protein